MSFASTPIAGDFVEIIDPPLVLPFVGETTTGGVSLGTPPGVGGTEAGPLGEPQKISGTVNTSISGSYVALEAYPIATGFTGIITPTFANDMYGRIVVSPLTIEAGGIVAEQVYVVGVFNTYTYPRTLESLVFSAPGSGVTTEGISLPTVFGSFEYREFTVRIGIEGSSLIDLQLLLNWDGEADDFPIRITGSRTVLLALPPNWSEPVTETFDWRTDIITSRNLVEQRRALWGQPKQTISYQAIMVDEVARQQELVITSSGSRSVVMPAWMDSSRLTAACASDATVLFCDTTERRFHAGGMAVLYESPLNAMTVEVEAVQPNRLVLKRPVGAAWPDGSRIFPALRGLLSMTTRAQRLTAGVCVVNVELKVSPSDIYAPEGLPVQLANGVEVFTELHNWSNAIDLDLTTSADDVEFDVGILTRQSRNRPAAVRRTANLLLSSRPAVNRVRGFIARRQGRLTPCLVSSRALDLIVHRNELPDSLSLTVKGAIQVTATSPLEGVEYLEIRTGSGDYLVRFSDVRVELGNTIFTLTNALGFLLQTENIIRVSLLRRSRMSSDKVTFTWRTAEVVETSLTFESLQRPVGAAV